ncbi:hypothetical protein [Actinoplanes sp. NPDC020271]|uniref:hypothetical protein n=1 Tax=Actinoplanes sp. NPDC020271 TaxID=3363896 RepID=UPI0037BD80AB
MEPRSLARPLLVGAGVLALVLIGVTGGLMLADRRDGDQSAGSGPASAVTQATSAYPEPATPDPTSAVPASAAPVGDPAAQAAAVDRILDRSAASRDKLVHANDAVSRCADVTGAIGRLRAVGDERTGERADLSALALSAVANGEAIRNALDGALAHSLVADQHYVKWAEERQENGCRETSSSKTERAAGDRESDVAGTAKAQFLTLWNPVAAELGLTTRDRQGI